MTYITVCDACQRDEHTKCEKGAKLPPELLAEGFCGGWHCVCKCKGAGAETKREAETKPFSQNASAPTRP